MKEKITKSFSYNLGMGIVGFFFNVFWTATVFYFLNWQISIWNLIIAAILVIFYWFLKDRDNIVKYCFWLILLFGLTFWISKSVYDLSGDGQSYHQETIIQIALGWNPLKERIVPDIWDSTHAVWMNHLARFSWIVSGCFYKVLGNIEMSKCLNLMLMTANFLVSWAFFKSRFKDKRKAGLLTAVSTLNPICLSEINTFGVDTQTASLLSLLWWNILIFGDKRESEKETGFSIILITVILFNLKMSALAYLFIIFIAGLIYFGVTGSKLLKEWLVVFVLAGILGVFILGFNPYITNTINYGNPFYPIYSKPGTIFDKSFSPHIGKVNDLRGFMIKTNSPLDFLNESWLHNFWRSTFSESANIYLYSIDNKYLSNTESRLKIPFTIRLNEFKAFIDSDVRVGGFGVWFSGALTLVFLLMVIMVLKRKNSLGKLFLLIVIELIMCRLNPEAWWARYVPFVWLVPVMAVYWSFREKDRILDIGGWILGLILMVNSFLILIVVIPFQIDQTKMLNSQYQGMLNRYQNDGMPINVDFVTTRSWRLRFFDKKIPFVESKMEAGVMENYFFKNLDQNEIELMKKDYDLDEIHDEYNLKSNVSVEDLKKLSFIFQKLAKVPLKREKIWIFIGSID
jgi:hypothetical protein